MKDESEGMYFVQVRQPTEVRKQVLETLRQTFEMLKRLEKLRQLRHEKLQNIEKLRVLFRGTSKMMSTLKLKLPQTNLKIPPARESHVKKETSKKPKVRESKEKAAPPQKKEPTEAEKLEFQLNAIESKLKNLT